MPKGVPEMPKYMGTASKRIWRRTIVELQAVGALSKVDGPALANYCKAEGLAERYFKDALAEPYVNEPVVNKKGEVVGYKKKLSPATIGFVNCAKLSKAFLIEFGLTPASRTKLSIEKKPDPADEVLLHREEAKIFVEPEIDLSKIDETMVN